MVYKNKRTGRWTKDSKVHRVNETLTTTDSPRGLLHEYVSAKRAARKEPPPMIQIVSDNRGSIKLAEQILADMASKHVHRKS
jgi:hypothetical protein